MTSFFRGRRRRSVAGVAGAALAMLIAAAPPPDAAACEARFSVSDIQRIAAQQYGGRGYAVQWVRVRGQGCPRFEVLLHHPTQGNLRACFDGSGAQVRC